MTSNDQERLKELAQLWHLTIDEKLAETGIALVYKVIRADATTAVLKYYKNGDPKNEDQGFEVLRHWDGNGAAYVYEIAPDALLLEYLTGPSLGDLSRSGKDDQTAIVLAKTAKTLHRIPKDASLDLHHIDHWYRDLFRFDMQRLDPNLRQAFTQAIDIAKELLATQGPPIILHGDLHHDNVIQGDRGWLCIDPKGILGEAEAEMANTYRNPKGGGDLLVSAERLLAMNRTFAHELDLDPKRLIRWGTVKTALSAVWQINAGLDTGPMSVLLPLLLELQDQPLS